MPRRSATPPVLLSEAATPAFSTLADEPPALIGATVLTAIRYYYVNGLRVAEQRDGVWTWTHSDHLHSATVVTDATGAEIRRLSYHAFGEQAQNTGPGDAPKYTYTAKEADQSGLMYYGARYYDPVLARFITADTLYDRGPQGLNRYSYALNNPMIYRDPTGHYVDADLDPEYVESIGADDNTYNDGPTASGNITGSAEQINNGTATVHNFYGDNPAYYWGAVAGGPAPNAATWEIIGLFLTVASTTPDDLLVEYVQHYVDQRGSRALSAMVFVGAMVLSVDDVASPNTWKKAKKGVGELLDAGKSKVDDIVDSLSSKSIIQFGQSSVKPTFAHGAFKGQSIADVAKKLRNGKISPDQLPVEYIVRNGEKVALNNRSLTTLRRAGMEPTRLIDRTGIARYEKLLDSHLAGGSASDVIRIRGGAPGTSLIE